MMYVMYDIVGDDLTLYGPRPSTTLVQKPYRRQTNAQAHSVRVRMQGPCMDETLSETLRIIQGTTASRGLCGFTTSLLRSILSLIALSKPPYWDYE